MNAKYQTKHETKAAAIKEARTQSTNNPDTIYSVIYSQEFYYVEACTPMIRNGEVLIGEYLFGLRLKP